MKNLKSYTPGAVGMATRSSETNLDTTVPDGDEDKMCEEEVKVMADLLCYHNPRDSLVAERVPKGETRRE